MASISPAGANVVMQRLHNREISDSGYWGHPAIATITFCEGDPHKCLEALKPRFRAVLDANPWMGGTFGTDGKTPRRTLIHPATGSDALVASMVTIQSNCPEVNRKTRYEKLVQVTGGNPSLTVQNGEATRKSGARVSKLVVVATASLQTDDATSPSTTVARTEFAIIFSM